MSKLERLLTYQLKAARFPPHVEQYPLFAIKVGEGKGVRKRLEKAGYKNYKYDFAWPELKTVVEVQGGTWLKVSGHSSGKGQTRDYDKLNQASELGWTSLWFTGSMIKSGRALKSIETVLKLRRSFDA